MEHLSSLRDTAAGMHAACGMGQDARDRRQEAWGRGYRAGGRRQGIAWGRTPAVPGVSRPRCSAHRCMRRDFAKPAVGRGEGWAEGSEMELTTSAVWA